MSAGDNSAEARTSARFEFFKRRWAGEMEWASDEDFEDSVLEETFKALVREEAKRRVASQELDLDELLPPPGETLADDLAKPRPKLKYAVDELHLAGGNTVLVASYKTGKTTLALNLAKAIADREPFLGCFEVAALDGRVGYLNYELGADTFREWATDIGFEHPERVAAPLHLRGRSLPFWHEEVRKQMAAWLAENEVDFLIVDPFARAGSGLVLNENDNSQVGAFLDALDALKLEAEVPNLLVATHMGRERFEENAERSRGATRLEDWMDAGWYLTKDSHGTRSLRAMGRDVDLEAFDLEYDPAERRLTATGLTRKERQAQQDIYRAVGALASLGDGVTTTALADAIDGDKNRRSAWIIAAARSGYIERRLADGSVHDETTSRPRGRPLTCYLTSAGRDMQSGIARRVGGGESGE